MKIKFTIIFCLLVTALCALTPPKPVKATPNFISKTINFNVGETTYFVSLPEGWGMGNPSLEQEKGSFQLFPQNGGYGCSFQIDRFPDDKLAIEEVQKLKKKFSKTTSTTNGFEIKLKKALYACYQEGPYVIQIWYSLPKKVSKDNAAIWKKLNQCMSVTEKVQQQTGEWTPFTEDFGGWMCNHPDKKLHVQYKESFRVKVEPNLDSNQLYSLKIEGGNFPFFNVKSGYFYVKWDQEDLANSATYQTHLNEMAADVLSMHENQTFSRAVFLGGSFIEGCYINPENGYGYMLGNPYSFVSARGDGFLIGFALEPGRDFCSSLEDYNFNESLKKVVWWRDE